MAWLERLRPASSVAVARRSPTPRHRTTDHCGPSHLLAACRPRSGPQPCLFSTPSHGPETTSPTPVFMSSATQKALCRCSSLSTQGFCAISSACSLGVKRQPSNSRPGRQDPSQEPLSPSWSSGSRMGRSPGDSVRRGRRGSLQCCCLAGYIRREWRLGFLWHFPLAGNPVWCLPIIAGEFYWSIATASKTPIIAAGVAVVIHYALTGWSKRATRVALLGAIAVVLSFSAFQSFKLGADATREFETSIEANYAPHLRPLLELERRFDQLSAVTDATFVNPSRSLVLSPTEAVTRAFKSALPTVIVGEKNKLRELLELGGTQQVRALRQPERRLAG